MDWIARLSLLVTGNYTILLLLGILARDFTLIKFRFSIMELLFLAWNSKLLILYWAACLGAIVPISTKLPTVNSRRKIFHLLVILLFVPAYYLNKILLEYALLVAFGLFSLVEIVRLYTPFGPVITQSMAAFLDRKDDQNSIIKSHFSLLIGCALPIFLSNEPLVPGLSGVLSIGVGDAAASIIGIRWGTFRLKSGKSLQGTIAFVFSLFLAMNLVTLMFENRRSLEQFRLFLDCFMTGLLETLTTTNDNIIVPLYFYSLLLNKI